MMNRKAFMLRLAAGLLAAQSLRAQPADRIARIGLLSPQTGPNPAGAGNFQILLAALRERGWVEGSNLLIDNRFAGPDAQRQRESAAALKAVPVALIVTAGTTTIRAARDGAPGVPIVMINAGDPVGSGFVASLARPGGDLTGTSAAGEEVLGKQLELLATAVPQRRRIGVLMNRANPSNDFFFGALAARAKTLGLQLERIDVGGPGELDEAIARARGGALVVLGDPMFGMQRARIIELAQHLQVATMFGARVYAVEGGLMSYLSADAWHWRKAASFIDRILKGARPAELPVEQPTEFDLVINQKAARALGLTLPPSLLLRADEVIE